MSETPAEATQPVNTENATPAPVTTDVSSQVKDILAIAGYDVSEVEDIISVLSKHGLSVMSAQQVAGDAEKIVSSVKGDPAMVQHVKTVFEEIGIGTHLVEEFFGHLFHHGVAVVPAAPSANM